MPLLPGKKNLSKNISEMLKKFKLTGMLGTSKPSSFKKARKQAIAAAFSKVRGGSSPKPKSSGGGGGGHGGGH